MRIILALKQERDVFFQISFLALSKKLNLFKKLKLVSPLI